ncbi:MAG: polyprenyl synthetase family protein [Methanomicrobiales archaeon]|nr:polyprenyl synthetase family protein [Methanomicrobiales archaeon]
MELRSYLENTARDVDLLIKRRFGDPRGGLEEASAHLLLAGGKRLRPALLLLAADAVKKGRSFTLVPAALAVELIHTFTLIHDDIMDRDSMRRGVSTVHTKWDEPTAILAGDVLYAKAFEYLSTVPAPEKLRVKAIALLAKTCAEICEGQYLDMSFEARDEVLEAEYLEMIRKKTGALFAASAAIGGILAEGSRMQVDALYEFGLATGMAFQMHDDLLDIISRAEEMGKDRASDMKKGKKTLIALITGEKGLDLSRFSESESPKELDHLVSQLREAGVIREVEEASERLIQRGIQSLKILSPSAERELLEELGRYFVTRRS